MLRSNTNYDIVLNAVAAGFVLELDEAAFKIFMPVAVKHLSLQENLPPLGLTWGEVKADWCDCKGFERELCGGKRYPKGWGGWGEDGFFRLRRGTKAGAPGMCGVAMSPLVPSDEPADSIQADKHPLLLPAPRAAARCQA